MRYLSLIFMGALSAILLLAPANSAAQEQQRVVSFKGTDAFRNLLGMFNLQSIPGMAELSARPAAETVLIVFGDLNCLDQLPRGALKKFTDNGGALLIASDRSDKERLRDYKLSIPGVLPAWNRRLPPQPKGPRQIRPYKGYDNCILIYDLAELSHPIFAGCKSVGTNAPSFIRRGPDCRFPVLCHFPPAPLEVNKVVVELHEEEAFAVGSSGKPGTMERLLFLSGHGVFMNVMYAQNDNDNLRFTVNTLRWLTDGKKRKHCLFIEDGQVVSEFSAPMGEWPMPTSRILNDLLRGLEEENYFNEELLSRVPKLTLLQAGLAFTLLALLLYGTWRLGRARFRQDEAVPLIEAKLAQMAADDAPLMTRRQQIQLRTNNFRDAARMVAKECFSASPGVKPPNVIAGSSSERRKLQHAVDKLWTLARGEGEPQSASASTFVEVVRMAAEVKAAIARGAVTA